MSNVFTAICFTADPEIPGGPTHTAILGMYSTYGKAQEAFTAEIDKGTWIAQHSCFRGDHEITKYILDQTQPLGWNNV